MLKLVVFTNKIHNTIYSRADNMSVKYDKDDIYIDSYEEYIDIDYIDTIQFIKVSDFNYNIIIISGDTEYYINYKSIERFKMIIEDLKDYIFNNLNAEVIINIIN